MSFSMASCNGSGCSISLSRSNLQNGQVGLANAFDLFRSLIYLVTH